MAKVNIKTGSKKTTSGARTNVRAGGVALSGANRAVPVGGGTGGSLLNLAADATGQFDAITPTFGNILSSVGLGVANSQAALDKGVIDTVNKLADTKITVLTEVVEYLDDDGLPDAALTDLIATDVSLLNFVTPTVHEWKQVAISMDMSVGAMDDQTGMSFSVATNKTSPTSVSLTSVGMFGFFSFGISAGYLSSDSTFRSIAANTQREAQWSNGSVQLDATLAPRRTTKFPTPASVSIGPQIFTSQGSIVETKVGGVVTERSVDVLINIRKASGAVNPSKAIELDAGGLLPSFSATAPFTGSTTNSDGQCKVTLRRSINSGFSQPVKRSLAVSLGSISKRFDVVI
jgi:hypothetical protein